MTSKKQDSGRTMIEMIAVLILVGILTLSGIFGFSWLVQRYKKTENAKTANTVIAALQNSRIIKKSNPKEPIIIKSVVSGPKTDDTGTVMVLSEEDDYYMVVTAMGPEEYIADLQIEPGTCAEYMNAFSESSALFKKDDETEKSDTAVALLEDIASQNTSKATFGPLSEEIIDRCEENEGRFRAAFNVTGKTDDEGNVYLDGEFSKCSFEEKKDTNGKCCLEKDMCGGVCDCAVCDKIKNKCVECTEEEGCDKDSGQICKDNVCECKDNATFSGGECKCDAGYTLNETTSTCEKCAKGTYKHWVGNEECTPCDPGTTTSGEGSTSKTECMCGENAIWYNGECLCAEGYTWNGTTCEQCAKGTYKAGISNDACESCGVGYYQDKTGQTSCNACGDNKTTDGEGSTAITQCVCDLGYTLNETTSTCEKCAAGTYKADIGNEACTDCPVGTYQNDMGQKECRLCLAGTYQDKTGQTTCNPCKVGTYQNDPGKDRCKDCGDNKTTDGEGSTESEQCVCMAGYTWKNGTCEQCAEGTYKADIGNGECTPCAEGTYQNEKGRTMCHACLAGHYQDKTGQKTCNPCPVGKYQTETGKDRCEPCGVGTYQDETGKTQCKACGVGTYQNETGKTQCKACGVGTYQNETGKTQCKACGVGTYQNEAGKTSCNACAKGKYQDETGKTQCKTCPANTTTAGTGATASTQCQSCLITESYIDRRKIGRHDGHDEIKKRWDNCSDCGYSWQPRGCDDIAEPHDHPYCICDVPATRTVNICQ